MARLDDTAACAADELGVEQRDLMPLLEPSAKTYYDFFHATPAGARVIADAVAAAVLRKSSREGLGSQGLAGLARAHAESPARRQKVS
jgi:hypothetical protein